MTVDHWGVIFDDTMTLVLEGMVVVGAFYAGMLFASLTRRRIPKVSVRRVFFYPLAIVLGILSALFDMPFCGGDEYPCPDFLDVRRKETEEAVVVTLFVACAAIAGFELRQRKSRRRALLR
jgi:hypothetical protein